MSVELLGLNIDTYSFERIKFGQTSVNEFAYLAPTYEKPTIEGVYTIYSETDLNNTYDLLIKLIHLLLAHFVASSNSD